MKLFIACSSSNDIDNKYNIDCKKYLEELFMSDNDLVFGAYNKGLMNIAYETAKKYKREVIGVTPKIFSTDLKNINCDKEIVTENINRRTEEAINEGDAIIFLPGGIGTIYEFFVALENKRSGIFNKPMIIYNSNNYFNELLKLLDKIYKEKFNLESIRDCYYISDSAKDTIEYINNYK